MKKKNYILIALLAIIIATITHSYLSSQHYDLKFGTFGEKSLCNVSATFNCDAVSASQYSQLFGIPMAFLGAITNGFLLLLLAISFFEFSSEPARTKRYAFYLSFFTFVVSVIMGTISVTLLNNLCLFCIATYILSVIATISTYLGLETKISRHLSEDIASLFNESKWVGVCLVCIPAVSFIGNKMVLDSHNYDRAQIMAQESFYSWQSAQKYSFDELTGLVSQKNKNVTPKITIVEFADFKCPHCKFAYPVLHAFSDARPDVKLIFKYYPLDGSCNSKVNGGDGSRCKLAYYTHCSEILSKEGWNAHHWIFDHQEDLHSADIEPLMEKMSQELKLDYAQLKQCSEKTETQDYVRKLAEEGSNAQIKGTPSVFINGKQVEGGQFLPVLQYFYEHIK